MQSDVPLDYALFQLSPRRSRCELLVSYDGTTERLASGLLQPYVTHLKVAEEQVALAVKSIKLEVDRYKDAEAWFTKGTVERFVQFVGTPEVLEMVNTYDAEMSQLEAARKIYSQGAGNHESGTSGGDGTGASASWDATKKELLRAIDVRLAAVKQDLTTACSRAAAAGFNPESVSELQLFADRFGAHRLSEACSKYITLAQRRSDLFSYENKSLSTCKASSETALRSSMGSDMSIDDPADEQPKPSTCTAAKVNFPLRRFSREPSPSPADDSDVRENSKDKDVDKDKDKDRGSTTFSSTGSAPSTSTGTPQLTRRLSVQERISLFETKAQKDSSPSTATTPTSTGGKPELRRLSSDVTTSTDKTVLRRWSGASDMSIDVSGERKEPDSNANTPTPTSASSFRPIFPPKPKDPSDLKSSEEGEKDSKLPVRAKLGSQVADLYGSRSGSEEPPSADSNSKVTFFSGRSSGKDQASGGVVRSRASSFGRGEELGLESQTIPAQYQIGLWPGKSEQFGSSDQTATEKVQGPSGVENKPQGDVGKISGSFATGFQGTELQGETKVDVLRDQQVPRSHIKATQKRKVEPDSDSETSFQSFQSHSTSHNSRIEGDSLNAQSWESSLAGEAEEARGKYFPSLENPVESYSMQMDNPSLVRGKSQGHGSGIDQAKKSKGGREERVAGSQMGSGGKGATEYQDAFSSTVSVPMDQVQRTRQPKGNQEMHDELKMKANELEKLFAEHKLRAPNDQSNSSRKARPSEMSKDIEGSPVNRILESESYSSQLNATKLEAESAEHSSNKEKFMSTPLMKPVDNYDYDVTPKHNIYNLSFPDDSRGKQYQKYMQRRDAKLREDWSSKGAEKEAKLKAMQDSLERSRAEMKVTLAGSADKRSSAYDARQRAVKMRSFNVRPTLKRDQPIDSFMGGEDDDQAEFLGKKLSETFLGDSSSRSAQSKKFLPNRNTASSTPRNSAATNPRSAGKASNSAAGRRRLPSDNPLAQSVPNFSDLRKENTKPYSAGSKPSRPQGRSHTRKKSTSEDLQMVNDEKPRRSQGLRKSTATPVELNDSRDFDDPDAVFTASRYDEVDNEDYEKFSKEKDSRTVSRKGNGVGRGAGSGMGRSKASEMVKPLRNGHNPDDVSIETEEMTDVVNDDEDELETAIGEDSADVDVDNSKERLSQESDKSANSVYVNSNAFRSLSQSDSVCAAELPSSVPSLFHPMGSIQDSPGESPGSWNSRLPNPFSFSHEISDIDVDSPNGSPASWNFHNIGQSEAEVARMRKKWGAAQKPIVGNDSSNGQSRKDVTRGLKRFLKFGRKNRASESLADWISVTTSEGDDSEDGRDLANRSSEDLRKSRMGFSQSHNSDEGFNGSDLFSEQVHALRSSIPTPPANFKLRDEHLSGSSLKAPKSFFSLSNFRSKANESKHR